MSAICWWVRLGVIRAQLDFPEPSQRNDECTYKNDGDHQHVVPTGVGYDGVLEPGMCICVESYVGRHGGGEGVKLEDQCVITETGYEKLSNYHLDARLMGQT